MRSSMRAFATYTWTVLAANEAVVLWGAYVRATGSGAGCGRHWPLCNGEIVPRNPSTERLIEFTHRASSGLALVLTVGLLFWAWRAFPRASGSVCAATPRGTAVRRGAAAALGFMLVEALLGAALVLFGLTGTDDSAARAVAMMVHLCNTLLLLGALTLTALWAMGVAPPRLRGRGVQAGLMGLALAGVVAVGATGAIAALGDTLFPAHTLGQALAEDFSPATRTLLRLRTLHPLLALVAAGAILLASGMTAWRRPERQVRILAAGTVGLVGLQLALGLVNVALLAPAWLQIVHLLVADLVWISLVGLAGVSLAEEPEAMQRDPGVLAR